MRTARIRKNTNKEKTEIIEEEYSIKKMLTIVFIVAIIFAVFYFITTLVVKPQTDNDNEDNTTPAVIDLTKITLNSLLSKSEKEYFVLATKKLTNSGAHNEISYKEIYNNYISKYKNDENAIKFYYIDLDDAMNKNYIGDQTNITDDLSKLKINDDVLFRIKNGKIDKYYVGSENITAELSSLTENE